MPARTRVAAWICVALGAVAFSAMLIDVVREARFTFDVGMLLFPAGLAMLNGHGPSRRWVALYLGFVVTLFTGIVLSVITARVESVALAGVEIRTASQALLTLIVIVAIAAGIAWALYSRPSREYFARAR